MGREWDGEGLFFLLLLFCVFGVKRRIPERWWVALISQYFYPPLVFFRGGPTPPGKLELPT